MTKYTKFEAIFRNETLVFTDRDPKFRNRLDVYNYICAERLGKKYGKFIRFRVKRRGCFSGRCSSLRRTIPSGKATVWC